VAKGDKRFDFLSDMLIENGYNVSTFSDDLAADVFVLPIPLKNKGEHIPAGKMVFGGGEIKDPPFKYHNLLADEDFLLKNAKISAEGALFDIAHLIDYSYRDANVMVFGDGRVGGYLRKFLDVYGAKVRFWSKEKDLSPYNIIINTIPAQIIDKKMLGTISKKAIVYDLATIPGLDFNAAEELELSPVRALGIPGKYAPRSAAKLIYNTIFEVLNNE